jgi:urea carboxylase-associated protein 1
MTEDAAATRTDSLTVPGTPVLDHVLAPGAPWAGPVRKGEILRLIDVEGQQVGDLVAFNLDRVEEKFSPPNTANLNRTIRLTTGHILYSDEASPMLRIVKDTVGLHDVLAGACSKFTNQVRYGIEDGPNCRDNFASAVERYGIGWKDVPYAFNIFMNVPVNDDGDGAMSIKEPISKAGDHIDLQAEMDCLVAISNCPQTHNACNAFELTPMRVIVYRPDSGVLE